MLCHRGEFESQSGRTALMIAAMYGCSDCARLLIDAGADMKVKDGVSFVTVLLLFRHYFPEVCIRA